MCLWKKYNPKDVFIQVLLLQDPADKSDSNTAPKSELKLMNISMLIIIFEGLLLTQKKIYSYFQFNIAVLWISTLGLF